MLNITGGKLIRPQKVVIYGSEGIGKTTFAAAFPDPLFIDTEGGTAQMDVKRLDKPESWDALVSLVEEVSQNPGICGSLVLDTADWAEQVCIKDLCARYKKSGIEEFGYGKGYTYVSEEFSKLLTTCDKVISAGMNVIITAHAKMRKFEQPDEMGAYDRWEMKLTRQVAPLLKEWSDMLLFCNYKTFVVTPDEGKNKVQGGKRVIYTSHHPCWDAKNRHGLPNEMNMEYANIAHIFAVSQPTKKESPAAKSAVKPVAESTEPSPLDELKKLMMDSHIIDEEVRQIVAKKGHFRYETPISKYPDSFVSSWIIPNWGKIVDIIEADPNRLPF